MAEYLGAGQAPAGGEADLPQCGQVGQPSADPEVAGVIDGGFRPDCLAQLVVLLDLRVLAVDVRARGDPPGDDPVRNLPGVGRLRPRWMRRPKTRPTWSGRPITRLSWMTWPEKIRPETGLPGTWVRENSACSTEMS
jgi:hypothetical protein